MRPVLTALSALAALAVATPLASAAPAARPDSACDRTALPTIAQNDRWRIVDLEPGQPTGFVACRRDARGPLRVMDLLPENHEGGVSNESASLRGDRVLMRGWARATAANEAYLLDLAAGTRLTTPLPATWSRRPNYQRGWVAITASGGLAWTVNRTVDGDKTVPSDDVTTLGTAGLEVRPLGATVVIAPPSGNEAYVRYPDISVRKLTVPGPPPVSAFALAPDLAPHRSKIPLRARRAGTTVRDLAQPDGDLTATRFTVIERAGGRGTIRATTNGKAQDWPLARGSAQDVQVLSANAGILIVKARFRGVAGQRVRVLQDGTAKPLLDLPAANLSPGANVAAAYDGSGGRAFAVSTLDGVLHGRAGQLENLGHDRGSDFAFAVAQNGTRSLYLTEVNGSPVRIPLKF